MFILPSESADFAPTHDPWEADENDLLLPDVDVLPAKKSIKLAPGSCSSATAVTMSPSELPPLVLGGLSQPTESTRPLFVLLSSQSPSPQKMSPVKRFAPQLPPAPMKAEASNTFLDFRRRYAKLETPRAPPRVSTIESDFLEPEHQRRIEFRDLRDKLRVAELELQKRPGSGYEPQRHKRKRIDADLRQQQQQRLAGETAHEAQNKRRTKTASAIPPYGGTNKEFILACAYLESLVSKKDTALHQSLWDDFVRFFTSVWMVRFESWKQRAREEDSMKHEDSFLDTLTVPDRAQKMEPPLSMYCTHVLRPVYDGCVVSPHSLSRVLLQYAKLAEDAKEWIQCNKPLLGLEGRPRKRSMLWE